ncbi:MAG TPA: helix-turn-helix domain-containing protein, partial [Kiloniellaceae bacterium]
RQPAAAGPDGQPAADAGPPGGILSDPTRAFDLRDTLRRLEHGLLQQALAARRFNQRTTARQLGLTYDQLRGRLRKHGLLGDAPAGDED